MTRRPPHLVVVARVLALVVAVVVATVAAPASVAAVERTAAVDVARGPADYLAAFDDAVLPALAVDPSVPAITGVVELDQRIRALAEGRGYRRRPAATVLVPVDGGHLQPLAARSWAALSDAAATEGITLVLRSGYRSVDDQRRVFLGRLRGADDAAIDATLRTAAPPGYSKHHTGYAVDIGTPERVSFHRTSAFDWLAADGYANARRFGWVPSYPVFGTDMGPDPEAWEFVWVGEGNLACPVAARDASFCDVPAGTSLADDVAWAVDRGVTVGCRPGRYCPDLPVTRGEAASMLWRMAGTPTPPADPSAGSGFRDVFADDHFADAVAWLVAGGVTTGTSPTTFSPDRGLAGAELLALLLRLDDPPMGPSPAVSDPVTRGELASVLRWWGADR